jgi:lipopolysaccharide export system protein LptA
MKSALIACWFILAWTPAIAEPAAGHVPATPARPTAASVQQNLGLGKHDANAPINVSSDNFQGDLATKVGTYIGNVVVVQGDMKMRAEKVRVDVTKGKPSVITATSNVVVVAPNGTATGDRGVYDLNTHTITMTGHVVLTKEKNVMRGTRLVMDMNTNLAHLTALGAPGGRVEASFTPPPQKPGTAPKAAADKKSATDGGK